MPDKNKINCRGTTTKRFWQINEDHQVRTRFTKCGGLKKRKFYFEYCAMFHVGVWTSFFYFHFIFIFLFLNFNSAVKGQEPHQVAIADLLNIALNSDNSPVYGVRINPKGFYNIAISQKIKELKRSSILHWNRIA